MNESLYTYALELAGIPLTCGFRYKKTADCFGTYVTGMAVSGDVISAGDWEWSIWPQTGKPVDAFAEYSLFVYAASSALLAHQRCCVHAAAFRRGDRGYLIVAEPGVGKSTQVLNLQELYPGEFSVICGDKPVLELREDRSIIVHPSPWNGKENWHGADAAPLGGVVLLRRGGENAIEPIAPAAAAADMYKFLIHTGESVEMIHQAAQIADAALSSAPVFQMTTYQVPDSTLLLYDALFGQGGRSDEL